MELFAPRHLLVILLIVLVVFGTKKLRTLGSDLGGAIRGFKQAMKEGEADEQVGRPTDATAALSQGAASQTERPEPAANGHDETGKTASGAPPSTR